MAERIVCSACGEEIASGPVLRAFGMTWHPHHLACKVCGKDFGDGSQCCEGPDGFAYCESDFKDVFTPACAACGQSVEEGTKVEAMGRVWHRACFKCPMCPNPFEALSFFPGEDGNPYCERHFYERQGLLCCVCECPITEGKRIRMDDRSYHAEHFCCEYCKKHLAGLIYKKHGGKPYCPRCHLTLFG